MDPEVQIYVLFDQTHLETGWDETGRSWRRLHFGGHTVKSYGGSFPEGYRFDLALSDTPGLMEVPWVKGRFGGVAYFYPGDDPDAAHAGVVSCQLQVPTDLFTDCLRLSSRLRAHGDPLAASISATQIGGGRQGERVLAFTIGEEPSPADGD